MVPPVCPCPLALASRRLFPGMLTSTRPCTDLYSAAASPVRRKEVLPAIWPGAWQRRQPSTSRGRTAANETPPPSLGPVSGPASGTRGAGPRSRSAQAARGASASRRRATRGPSELIRHRHAEEVVVHLVGLLE